MFLAFLGELLDDKDVVGHGEATVFAAVGLVNDDVADTDDSDACGVQAEPST